MYSWLYDNNSYKTNFEAWYNSVDDGAYIGRLFAGWVALVIGFKQSHSQGSDGNFVILKYNFQNGFEKFASIENGVFSWGAY